MWDANRQSEVDMDARAVTVEYRYSEGGQGHRSATYRGRLHERTEAAVRRRLREVHRFAESVEVVAVRWDDDDHGGGDQRLPSPHGQPGAAPAPAGGDRPWARRHERCSMFKPAQVVLEDAALDCVLLDLSPGGAQVCLLARAELPDRVILRLPGGGSLPVRRRRQRGSHVGFEAVGEAVPPS
jgi:hypothetical protein